jgi:small-conductance mechanosensitive channel/CRP-like cAMP-binding protein
VVEFLEKLPLSEIRTVALAVVYSGSTLILLRVIIHYFRNLPPIARHIRLANFTIWLFTLYVFLWSVGVPISNFFLNAILAIALTLGGFILIITVEYLLFDLFFERGRRPVHTPALLRDVLRMAVLFMVIFVVLSRVFNFDLSTVLVSSAILTAVVGLALQDLLSSIIAGVVLNVEKPFDVGDCVNVAGQDGRVISVSWRSTRLKTPLNNYMVIPNNSISQAEIINYSQPNTRMAMFLKVGTSYNDPPHRVKKAIEEVAMQVPGILKNPAPLARTIEYSDFSINYSCRYYIDSFDDQWDIGDDFATRLWYRFKRDGIEIPFPIRTIQNMRWAEEKKEAEIKAGLEKSREYLRAYPLFQDLSDDEIARLAENSPVRLYGCNENVITRGESGDSMFITVSGRLKVMLVSDTGAETELAGLGPGDAFGEMSLFTGENRSATVRCIEASELVEITKEDFKEILENDETLVEKLAEKISSRSREIEEKIRAMDVTPETDIRKETTVDGLFRLIKNFFEL